MNTVKLSTLPESVRKRIVIDHSGCWLWTGPLFGKGYGYVTFHQRQWLIHRFVYWTLRQRQPQSLHHVCETKHCVNPDHLKETTPHKHMRYHKKALCKNGHPLNGMRRCRLCSNTWHRQRRLKHLEEIRQYDRDRRQANLEIFRLRDKQRYYTKRRHVIGMPK